MNKYISTLGVILLLLSIFFFYIVFVGGRIGSLVITDGIPIANFAAFLFAIVFLPIGTGLAFIGFAYRRPAIFSSGGERAAGGAYASSTFAKAILAVAIIAVLVSATTLAAVVAVDSSLTGLSGKGAVSTVTVAGANSTVTSTVTATGAAGASGGGVNETPSTVPLKVDWCNTDNTGQDRYCPSQITVIQGDVVEVMFISNDTDAHTFEFASGYSFRINDSSAGMHNFLTNEFNSGNCSNTGTFSQISAGESGTYCVSGSSLLSNSSLTTLTGSTDFPVAQNPTPGNAFNGTAPILVSVDNQVHFINASASTIAFGTTEVWGIGAFQASTPGIYEFFCHYHVSNGMFGYLIVLPNAYCTSHAGSCGNSTVT